MAKMGDFHLALVVGDVCVESQEVLCAHLARKWQDEWYSSHTDYFI